MKVDVKRDIRGMTSITLEINPYDLIHDTLNEKDREVLIESLSCAEDVIKHVIDQLIDGCTDQGFSGRYSTSMVTAIQQGRMQILEELSTIELKTVNDLKAKIASLEKDVDYWRDRTELPRW